MTTLKLAVLYAFLLLACASCPEQDVGRAVALSSDSRDATDVGAEGVELASAAGDAAVEDQVQALRRKIHATYSDYKKADFPHVADVSVAEALRRLDTGLLFIDARSTEERAVSTLPSALSLEEFRKRLEQHPQLKERDLIVYCTIGYRSAFLTMTLRAEGLQAYNLQGGILAWVAHGQIVQQGTAICKRIHTYAKQWSYLPLGYEAVY